MAETRRLIDLIERTSDRLELPDGGPVVALSGGADSAALAFLTKELAGDTAAVHVDHGLEFSPQLRRAAVETASLLEIDLQVLEVDVPDGPSLEGQARRARYGALAAGVASTAAILTAHTFDDQAETVLMNIVRGAGLRGLSGIPRFRPPNVYRPMLSITRSETREISLVAGLPFLDDPMNLDPTIRRNAFRLQVLPDLRRFNPRLDDALARLATSAGRDWDHLEQASSKIEITEGSDTAAMPVGSLRSVDESVRSYALDRLVRRLRTDGLTVDELERVEAVVEGLQSGCELAGGLDVFLDGAMLRVTRAVAAADELTEVALDGGSHSIGSVVLDVTHSTDVCRVAPIGVRSALFPDTVQLTGRWEQGAVVVLADGIPAWTVGVKRHPPGTSGYLSVNATEGSD